MNSKREQITFWSLLIINPLLMFFLSNTTMTTDNNNNLMPLAQTQTQPESSSRGPASEQEAIPVEIKDVRQISWNTPMAFDKETLEKIRAMSDKNQDQDPKSIKK